MMERRSGYDRRRVDRPVPFPDRREAEGRRANDQTDEVPFRTGRPIGWSPPAAGAP